MAAKKKKETNLIDVAADLINGSDITLDTVAELAANAVTGKGKRGSTTRRKKSKSDDLISKLIPEIIDFPQFSEKTYWNIRDMFKKDVPDDVTVSTLAKVTGLKADSVKDYVIPALALLGLLKEGKPTSKLKSWINDAKYVDTCLDIAKTVYPDALRKLGYKTEDEQKDALDWFVKNAKVSASTAKKMLGVYLLLIDPKLRADTDKKATAALKAGKDKKAPADEKKSALDEGIVDTLKIAKKAGQAAITLKILTNEDVTKKALAALFAKAAADAYKQLHD